MNTASSQEIREALKDASKTELMALCLRLARFKKENKELLDYLLFHAHDLEGYIGSVKREITEGFERVNTSSVFLAKKTLRKILRDAKKHIRYTGSNTAEAELLLCYLDNMAQVNLPWRRTKILRNIYEAQLKKIAGAIKGMHEDLQYDYKKHLETVERHLHH